MNGHLLRGSLGAVMVCLGLATEARAQSAKIAVMTDYYGCGTVAGNLYVCSIRFNSPAESIRSARFKVVSSSPVVFIDAPVNQEYDLTFTPCAPPGDIAYFIAVVGGPAPLRIVPATGHTEIELTDCDGYAIPTVDADCQLRYVAPYRPNPPTGAVDVPTNPLLSYIGTANIVKIGTSPTPDSSWNLLCVDYSFPQVCPLPLDPGPLAPNTTYYWQAIHDLNEPQIWGAQSEIFSFTTGDAPLAVESSTWGRVKAMYRE